VLLAPGSAVRFSVDPANLYLFDRTGKAIARTFHNENLALQAGGR
jgi:hypothetical protein